MDGVDKVMFAVDRKDLDYPTMREYDRLEKGTVDGSKSSSCTHAPAGGQGHAG